MKKLETLSPAKINLNLKIGNIQKNSLHKIDSELHTINLFDEIEATEMPFDGKQKIKIEITGDQKKGVPSNSENLIYKAAKAFFKETKITSSIAIRINKNIPNKAGLGGASSNAASIIKILEKMFEVKIAKKKMTNICHELGSDVPFFYFGAPHAMVSETGEKIAKIKPNDFYCCIAMLPKIQISTSWAFAEFDKFKSAMEEKIENDFEKVIFNFFPDLARLKDEFLKYQAEKSGLTGSGSAIYAIFKNSDSMAKCIKDIAPKCAYFWSGKSL